MSLLLLMIKVIDSLPKDWSQYDQVFIFESETVETTVRGVVMCRIAGIILAKSNGPMGYIWRQEMEVVPVPALPPASSAQSFDIPAIKRQRQEYAVASRRQYPR